MGPAGQLLVALDDGAIDSWLPGRPSRRVFPSGGPFARLAAVSPDLRLVATSSTESTTSNNGDRVVARNRSGRVVWQWASHDNVVAIAVDPSHLRLAIATNSGRVMESHLTAGTPPFVIANLAGGATAVGYATHGDMLAIGGRNGDVLLRRGGDRPRKVGRQAGVIQALAFRADGRYLATASLDKTARVWSIASPEEQPRVLEGHQEAIKGIAFAGDGSRLVTAAVDGVRVWDWPRALTMLRLPAVRGVSGIAAVGDDPQIIQYGSGRTVSVTNCDVCGSARETEGQASARLSRTFTPEERRAFQIVAVP